MKTRLLNFPFRKPALKFKKNPQLNPVLTSSTSAHLNPINIFQINHTTFSSKIPLKNPQEKLFLFAIKSRTLRIPPCQKEKALREFKFSKIVIIIIIRKIKYGKISLISFLFVKWISFGLCGVRRWAEATITVGVKHKANKATINFHWRLSTNPVL